MVIQKEIEQKLEEAFSPVHMQVINESYMHNVPEGSESHFKVHLVSTGFNGMMKVRRHQAVYQALSAQMEKIHALALFTMTPEEYGEKSTVPDSPRCLGGSKAESKGKSEA